MILYLCGEKLYEQAPSKSFFFFFGNFGNLKQDILPSSNYA